MHHRCCTYLLHAQDHLRFPLGTPRPSPADCAEVGTRPCGTGRSGMAGTNQNGPGAHRGKTCMAVHSRGVESPISSAQVAPGPSWQRQETPLSTPGGDLGSWSSICRSPQLCQVQPERCWGLSASPCPAASAEDPPRGDAPQVPAQPGSLLPGAELRPGLRHWMAHEPRRRSPGGPGLLRKPPAAPGRCWGIPGGAARCWEVLEDAGVC